MPDEREKFTLGDMLENFDIQRVSLGGPVFDVEKLRWLNGLWLREELDDEQLLQRLHDWAYNREYVLQILPQVRSRIETFSDLAPLAMFLFAGDLQLNAEDFNATGQDTELIITVLQFSLWRLERLPQWDHETLFNELKAVAEGLELKIKPFLAPLFIAITGAPTSISVIDAMVLLGPDLSRARLRRAIDLLGGVGKKKLKKLEKDYAAITGSN